MARFTRIEKEELQDLHPLQKPISPNTKLEGLRKDLFQALFLGNVFHQKVVLNFLALEGAFEVETTVWSVTDEHIGLKGGLRLPLHSLAGVRLV